MRIDGNDLNLDALFSVQNKDQRSDNQDVNRVQQPGQCSDRLEFSTDSRTFQPLLDRVQGVPEIRSERVAEITRQLESGSYDLHAQRIAEKIITGSLVDTKA